MTRMSLSAIFAVLQLCACHNKVNETRGKSAVANNSGSAPRQSNMAKRRPMRVARSKQPFHTNRKVPVDATREILINTQCFMMSEKMDSSVHIYAAAEDRFVHRVCVSSYVIDKYEVTVNDYLKCVSAAKCAKPGVGLLLDASKCNYPSRKKYPVNCVKWTQAAAYCRYVGKRLPTEAEWELAGRGPTGKIYPWGSTLPSCKMSVVAGCGSETTRRIGSKKMDKSSFGIYDMSGNVSEWVNDFYDNKYYPRSPLWNPRGPNTGRARVVRGGSYIHSGAPIRLTYRQSEDPSKRHPTIGFRCARTWLVGAKTQSRTRKK